jgi:hypothetical protein
MSRPKSNPEELANACGIGLIMLAVGYVALQWAHIIAVWASALIN